MSITRNFLDSHDRIHADPHGAGRVEAEDLGALATAAIRHGMDSPQWVEYMSKFAKNADELKRLSGKDALFNKTEWGIPTLAYLVANSTCTIDTHESTGSEGTVSYLTQPMRYNLDYAVDDPSILDKRDVS